MRCIQVAIILGRVYQMTKKTEKMAKMIGVGAAVGMVGAAAAAMTVGAAQHKWQKTPKSWGGAFPPCGTMLSL